MNSLFSFGLDFGTESVRAILVRIGDGVVAGQAAAGYGMIDREVAGTKITLPGD